MATTLFIVSVIVIAVSVVTIKYSENPKTLLIAAWAGGIALLVAVVTGIVLAVGNHNEDKTAVNAYLEQQGYHVVSLDYKSRKGYHNSYWEVDVYRVNDPACGGTIKVKRYGDRSTITDGLAC